MRNAIGAVVRRGGMWLGAMWLGMLAGCGQQTGSSGNPPPKPAPSETPQSALRRIDPAGLPALGGSLPPLDDGRVEISRPEDWQASPRSSKYLVRFVARPHSAYPSLVFNALDTDFPAVTEQNVSDWAARVAEEWEARLAPQGVRLDKPVTPVRIGEFVGVEYVRRAQDSRGRRLSILMLDTVAAGRRYQLELYALEGTFEHDRPFAYTVAAGLKFHPADEAGQPAGEDTPPQAATP